MSLQISLVAGCYEKGYGCYGARRIATAGNGRGVGGGTRSSLV